MKLLKQYFTCSSTQRNAFALSSLFLISLVTSTSLWADIQPRNASLNYSQKSLSNAGNPAAAALIVERKDPHVMTGGAIELGGGIEYGNFDELFAKIDELSLLFSPPSEDDSDTEQPPSPTNPVRDYIWEDLFYAYPELEDRLEAVKLKVATTAGLLAVIAAEGYGKAEASSEASFVLSEDLYEGTLLFGMSYKGNSKAVGIFEEINFNAEYAKEQLKTIPSFDENDPVQALPLSDGITLHYNPANHKMRLSFENDSLLLVKATKIAQLSFSYSRLALDSDAGNLYWGVKPTFYNVGLTNVGTRIGDISDTEALFDDIENSEFIKENGFDIDLGLVWAAEHYQLGASLANVIEQDYEFPELEETGFSSTGVLNRLAKESVYTMERQLKLEAGIFTNLRHWSLNVELDANAVEDPMRDEYQWLTLTGGYASDSWWLPSARVGFSRNLAGSKLTYLNAGVTVMKFINIDVATTLDTVTLDNNDLRRGANIRLGVQFDY